MFGKRQTQAVDFNQLLEQMRDGEEARMMIDRIRRYLNACVVCEQRNFADEVAKQPKDKEFYTFYYPFVVPKNEDLQKIMDIIDYDMPEELQRKMEEDYTFATAWNREVEAMKRAENNG